MKNPAITIIAIALTALPTSCSSSSSSPSAQAPYLAGTWLLNVAESESLADRIEEMRRGRPGEQPQGAMSPAQREEMRQNILAGIEAFRAFKLEQNDSTITLQSAEGPRYVFFTDGREVRRSVLGYGGATVRARWKGEKFEIERKLDQGSKLIETYELSDEGDKLNVKLKISGPGGSIDFERIYDRARVDG
jgi:hypothetical protein